MVPCNNGSSPGFCARGWHCCGDSGWCCSDGFVCGHKKCLYLQSFIAPVVLIITVLSVAIFMCVREVRKTRAQLKERERYEAVEQDYKDNDRQKDLEHQDRQKDLEHQDSQEDLEHQDSQKDLVHQDSQEEYFY